MRNVPEGGGGGGVINLRYATFSLDHQYGARKSSINKERANIERGQRKVL